MKKAGLKKLRHPLSFQSNFCKPDSAWSRFFENKTECALIKAVVWYRHNCFIIQCKENAAERINILLSSITGKAQFPSTCAFVYFSTENLWIPFDADSSPLSFNWSYGVLNLGFIRKVGRSAPQLPHLPEMKERLIKSNGSFAK